MKYLVQNKNILRLDHCRKESNDKLKKIYLLLSVVYLLYTVLVMSRNLFIESTFSNSFDIPNVCTAVFLINLPVYQ